MMKFMYIFLLLLMSSCVTPPQKHETLNTFSSEEIKWFSKIGTSSIKGSAFLKTNGGRVITCAGNEVHLFPKSKYSNERMKVIYGDTSPGPHYQIKRYSKRFKQLDLPDGAYIQASKKTRCNAKGEFEFKNLPKGDYFVNAKVIWKVQYTQGGSIMYMLSITEDNKEYDIIVSP